MKAKKSENYLERKPLRKESIGWKTEENGLVTLEIENKGVFNRIAQMLLKKPKILILDDSTSAVDTRTDALIKKAFAEEIPNTTKFIIAQRISSVEDADVIIVLDGGRVNGIGTHESLLETNEIYREVYEQQTNGGDANEEE